MEPKVTIVLVNYNAQLYMEDFFASVWKQDYHNFNVILIDNASSDTSVQWLEENQKQIFLLQLQANVGFGEGSNIGIREAIAQGAEYVLLLNIDTVLKPDLVRKLVKYAAKDTATTAMTYCGEDKNNLRLWYAGGEINYETANVNQVQYEVAEREYYDVKFISGCCMLLHKEVIQKVGYFDKDYYLYYEDADYCARMEKASVKMRYVTTTSLWHKVGGSSIGGNEMSCSTQYFVTRNRLLFADRNTKKFKKGNLSVLRKILEERAFFDGKENAKYRLYIECAIADFLREYYGKGYYGDILINDRYYIAEGFYEKETRMENSWYWANSRSAKFYIANPKRDNVVYNISFELALPETAQHVGTIDILIDGKYVGKYLLPCHVEFTEYVTYESTRAIDLVFQGEMVKDTEDNNERNLCYQLINLKVEDIRKDYYLEEGFYQTEGNDTKWNWSSSDKGLFFVVNKKNHSQLRQIDMIIETYEKGKEYKVALWQDEKKWFLSNLPCAIRFPLELKENQKSRFLIETDAPVMMDGEREVCFKIRDMHISDVFQEVYWGNYFWPEETDEENSWHWCSMNEGTIYIVNNTEREKIKCVSLEIAPFMNDDSRKNEVKILENNKRAVCSENVKKCEVLLQMKPYGISVLDIRTQYDVGLESDNGRSLGFKVSNFKVDNIIDKKIFMGTGFYPQETNGVNTWNWAYEQSAEIIFSCIQAMEIRASFVLQCDCAFSAEKVKVFMDDFALGEYEYEKLIEIAINNEYMKCHKLRIVTEHQPYRVDGHDRQFTFKIVDFRLQDIDKG